MALKRILVYGLCEKFGGTERYVLTLYKALEHDKIQFDFLFDHATGFIPYEKEIISFGGRIYREYYKNRDKNLPGAVSVRELFQRHPEWSGVYINCQAVDTSYRLLIEAKRIGIECRVIHSHNNNYMHTPTKKDKIVELFFLLTKHRYVTKYLACSQLAGEWMFKGSRFTVIPNAVDFTRFQYNIETREIMRKKYHIGEQTKVVGFCGRLVYQKNPQLLVKIFSEICRQHDDVILLIVGDGLLRSEVEGIATELQIQDKLIMSGSVENVEDYMQMMDCFLLPSRFEGFGIVLLEAQASGLNCITTKDVVPAATNITGHVHFVDSEADETLWAKELLSVGFERYNELETLLASDYTVEKSVQKLMKIFEI